MCASAVRLPLCVRTPHVTFTQTPRLLTPSSHQTYNSGAVALRWRAFTSP
jgi:hypothetical protein